MTPNNALEHYLVPSGHSEVQRGRSSIMICTLSLSVVQYQ